MRSFECWITDDRYTVRQTTWLLVETEERAVELARQNLADAPHQSSVELRENGRVLRVLTRSETPDGSARADPR
ncbi:hypothetical protein [Phenylobacterium sp.]|jgi:predicted O-methyltransferase YrrM|uniref:hypothetical protein n=1 Tax=Phenylobacterium sp. TaxID=1871053 RepID=UPI002F959E04